uniref:Pentraxin family member n=1 Tax=Ornithorhynchus anatinus TaxID=9258 RepID=F6PVZ6_ORNAN
KLIVLLYSPRRLGQSFAHTDLFGKVFLFPRESANSFSVLKPKQDKPLEEFTICLQAYSDLTRPYSLFSYATESQDNEILLFKEGPGMYSLSVGGFWVLFRTAADPPDSKHICATWESATGIAELWVDGKRLVRKGLRAGYKVGAGGQMILGQEQDSFGGDFKLDQSFVGEIGDLCLWDRVLSEFELFDPDHCGNLLNWESLSFENRGYVVIKPNN